MRFHLGQTVATRGAVELMEVQDINPLHLLLRHANGDDGDLDADDKALNATAIASGVGRIFSSYRLASGDRLWVITEADRSSTTIMLPEDY